jgi:uncharacterized membrane protein
MQRAKAEAEYSSVQRQPWLDYTIVALCLAGILVAGYLSYTHLFNQSIVCTTGGGCDRVNSSKYASFLSIPVAYIGLAGYLFLLGASLLRWRLPHWRSRLDWLLFLAGLFGFVFSAYLTVMELFVIEAICTWCVVSATLMTILFGIYAVRIWRGVDEIGV